MADDKKSFLMYADLLHTIKRMPDDKAGLLFKHILEYVNDLNPITDDLIVELTFEPIKQQLKRDLLKWDKNKVDKSINGRMGNLKRYNLDIYNMIINEQITLDNGEILAKSRKTSLSDSLPSPPVAKLAVTDTVTVTVTDNVINNTPTYVDVKEPLSIDFEKLKEFWNSKTENTSVPKIQIFSKQRKSKIKNLVIEHGKDSIIRAINNLFESDFCTGKSGTWKADFDFLTQQSSFIKLIEGSYSNNQSKPQQTQINVSPPSQYKKHEL